MAEKKPRLRKSAPTIRERVESSQLEPKKKAGRFGKALSQVKRPLKKARLPQNRFFRALVKILKRLLPSYLIGSWQEVKQVTWPNRRETWRLTGAVFIFAIIFGAMVAAVDKGLEAIFKNIVLK